MRGTSWKCNECGASVLNPPSGGTGIGFFVSLPPRGWYVMQHSYYFGIHVEQGTVDLCSAACLVAWANKQLGNRSEEVEG